MLAIHDINNVPVKIQPMTKQSQQISFGNSLNKDTFSSSKSQVGQTNVSFGGLIPQFVLRVFGKDDKSIKEAALNTLVTELVTVDPSSYNRLLESAGLSDEDKDTVRRKTATHIVKDINKTDSKELQQEKIAFLTELDLIGIVTTSYLHFKGVMKSYENQPFSVDAPGLFPSKTLIENNKAFINAVNMILDSSNPDKADAIKQYTTAAKDHLLSKTEHWAGLRSEAVDILRDNAQTIEDIEPFFSAIELNKITGTEIIGGDLPIFHKITYPLDIEVKVKALNAISAVLNKIDVTPAQVEAVRLRIDDIKNSTDKDQLKLACYEILEQMG